MRPQRAASAAAKKRLRDGPEDLEESDVNESPAAPGVCEPRAAEPVLRVRKGNLLFDDDPPPGTFYIFHRRERRRLEGSYLVLHRPCDWSCISLRQPRPTSLPRSRSLSTSSCDIFKAVASAASVSTCDFEQYHSPPLMAALARFKAPSQSVGSRAPASFCGIFPFRARGRPLPRSVFRFA